MGGSRTAVCSELIIQALSQVQQRFRLVKLYGLVKTIAPLMIWLVVDAGQG